MKYSTENWEELLLFLNGEYGIQKNLLSVLFLIGLHKYGTGFKKYSQDEKTDIIKKVEFDLLCGEKYYLKVANDLNDQPVWVENPEKEIPGTDELEKLLEKLILNYFNTLK